LFDFPRTLKGEGIKTMRTQKREKNNGEFSARKKLRLQSLENPGKFSERRPRENTEMRRRTRDGRILMDEVKFEDRIKKNSKHQKKKKLPETGSVG